MPPRKLSLSCLQLLSFLSFPSVSEQALHSSRASALETIRKDVLVIGGGSAGTYGAVRLHDAGKSVVVVEPSGKLGGNAETYVSPTGGVVNVGVQILYDIPVVAEYFTRLNVPLITAPATTPGLTTINADFALGALAPEPPANASSTQQAAIAAALQRYGEYLAANLSSVYPGYFLPDPVPEDFLLTYGEFMTKYGLDAIVNLINQFIQPAEAWRETALFPLKLLGLDPLLGIANGFKVTRDLNDLYRAAAAVLGGEGSSNSSNSSSSSSSIVLYNSSIVSLTRGGGDDDDGSSETNSTTSSSSSCDDDDGHDIEAIISTPTGPKRILASKLLMTAPPVLSNLAGWDDLSPEESALFGKFKSQNYHAGVIRNAGLPANATLQNVGFTSPFNCPPLPALFNVVPTGFGDGTAVAYYTAREDEGVDVATAQADTLATLERLAAAGVFPSSSSSSGGFNNETEILEWFNHVNVRMYVDSEDVRDGFYRRLYALQGQRNTYWSGAAWVTQASSPIWDYTKSVVDEMMLAVL